MVQLTYRRLPIALAAMLGLLGSAYAWEALPVMGTEHSTATDIAQSPDCNQGCIRSLDQQSDPTKITFDEPTFDESGDCDPGGEGGCHVDFQMCPIDGSLYIDNNSGLLWRYREIVNGQLSGLKQINPYQQNLLVGTWYDDEITCKNIEGTQGVTNFEYASGPYWIGTNLKYVMRCSKCPPEAH